MTLHRSAGLTLGHDMGEKIKMKQNTARLLHVTVVLAAVGALAACQTPPPAPPPAAPVKEVALPPPPPPTRAASIEAGTTAPSTAVEALFVDGVALYEKGAYPEAIAKLSQPELGTAWPDLRVRALKYLAFSHCVADNLDACQQAFYDAIQITPNFTLTAAEQGHPIWGKVFEQAKVGPPKAQATPSLPVAPKAGQPPRRRAVSPGPTPASGG